MKTVAFNSLGDPKVASLFMQGAVGVIPTDTVYGLACRAANQAAVARLYQLKLRTDKPGTLIAATIDQLVELGLKARYLKAVTQFWPNPISIIIPSVELEYIHLGKRGIAVRIPSDAGLQKLLTLTGPLLTTSANHPGKPEATNIDMAQKYFGDTLVLRLSEAQGDNEKRTEPYQEYGEGVSESATQRFAKSTSGVPGSARQQADAAQKQRVDFYVDGGDLSDRKPSTVIRIIDDAIEVLRQGAVTIDQESGRIIT